jgi:hypothetical protein
MRGGAGPRAPELICSPLQSFSPFLCSRVLIHNRQKVWVVVIIARFVSRGTRGSRCKHRHLGEANFLPLLTLEHRHLHPGHKSAGDVLSADCKADASNRALNILPKTQVRQLHFRKEFFVQTIHVSISQRILNTWSQ